MSRPLISSALSLQHWIVGRAAERDLDFSRDLVHLVPVFIRSAHQRVLLSQFGLCVITGYPIST
ncbi:hypothetical protein A5686_06175 [Mycobacterium sp. E2479]|nr:hypothetical protein A5686_06175 [Mycobacterium sp. E2479]